MSALREVVARLGRHMAERRAQRPDPGPATRTRRRIAPPGGTPTALFADRALPQRRWCEDLPVHLNPGRGPLWYTGPRLSVEDRAVFDWLLSRLPDADGSVRFPATACLRALGRGRGMTDRQRLRQALLGLQGAVLTRIDADGTRRSHSLIERVRWQPTPGGRSGHWRVWLDPTTRALFGPIGGVAAMDRNH